MANNYDIKTYKEFEKERKRFFAKHKASGKPEIVRGKLGVKSSVVICTWKDGAEWREMYEPKDECILYIGEDRIIYKVKFETLLADWK